MAWVTHIYYLAEKEQGKERREKLIVIDEFTPSDFVQRPVCWAGGLETIIEYGAGTRERLEDLARKDAEKRGLKFIRFLDSSTSERTGVGLP